MEKFLASLFDFSFRKYITPTIVKFVYMLFVGLSAIWALLLILIGFSQGVLVGLLTLVLAPAVFLACVCVSRLFLEAVISMFRIANYAAEMARATRTQGNNPIDTDYSTPTDH